MRLRSIELNVENPQAAEAFFLDPWGMASAPTLASDRRYLRGSGSAPYLVGLYPAVQPSVASVTFTVQPLELQTLIDRATAYGAAVTPVVADDPGGGEGVIVLGPEQEVFRFLAADAPAPEVEGRDLPVRLTHIVFNATDAEASADFVEAVLGFKVSDRTRGMVFIRCNESHHSIAFARAGYPSLNHIAFEMQDMDAVMRGIGRLRDVEVSPAWGPGRHGPGANVFAYFIAPFGAVVEFSTAVEKVSDDYRTGAPEDWSWPPNRIDQWGVSNKDLEALDQAERRYRFAPLAPTSTGRNRSTGKQA